MLNKADTEAFLFMFAMGIGLARWWFNTSCDEQLRLLRAWKPARFDA
jgi:hypothetical protein